MKKTYDFKINGESKFRAVEEQIIIEKINISTPIL